MIDRSLSYAALCAVAGLVSGIVLGAPAALADGNLQNVNHIIIVMMENRSFDNYFGVLPFVPGSPYHNAKGPEKKRACPATDNTCVDGLTCRITSTGDL